MRNNNKIRIGLFLDEELLKRCDAALPLTDHRSRSEFISVAIDQYVAQVNAEGDCNVLFPMLDESLDGRMKDQEMRLSRVLFKLGVEIIYPLHPVLYSSSGVTLFHLLFFFLQAIPIDSKVFAFTPINLMPMISRTIT